MTELEFTQTVNDTKRIVLAAIRRFLYVEHHHAIDDVAQEVYLRAYKALQKGNLKENSKIRSYLFTIAKNECFRMNKKIERERAKQKRLQEQNVEQYSEISEDFAAFDQVESAIGKIPAVYRSVVRMLFKGYSPKDISKELRLNPGTVKSRTNRGMAFLKIQLGLGQSS